MLSKFSVKRPLTVIVGVLLAVILGVISFLNMTTDLLPNMDLPYIAVITNYPGASPEKVEASVTKPLEQVLSTTSGVSGISSVSRENSSMIVVEFVQGTNMDSAMIEMSSNVDLVRSQLSSEVGSPMLMKIDPTLLPIMVASVDVDNQDLIGVSKMVSENVVPELERVDGLASVNVSGLIEERVEVALNQQKIDELNERVLRAVDEELSDKQKELDDAKKELEDGKKEYEKAGGKREDLIEAGIKLEDGKAQAQAGASVLPIALEYLQTQLAELQQQRRALAQAINQVENLPQLKAQLEAMTQEAAAIPGRIAQLQAEAEALKADVAALQNKVNDPALTQAERDAAAFELAEKSAELSAKEKEIADLTARGQELSAAIPQLGAAIAAAEAAIAGNGTTVEDMRSALAKLDEGIASLNAQISGMASNESELESTIEALNENQKKLELGKMTMSAELAKAAAVIAMGESQLEQAEKAFEDAKEQAYKQAGLDGVITQDTVSKILAAENFAMPAGYITEGEDKYIVKVGDQFKNPEEIENLVVFNIDAGDIGLVMLRDVADISMADNMGETYAKINGNDGVLLTFQKQSTASTSTVSHAIREAMAKIEAENPGLHLTVLQDQGVYIDIVIDSVLNNLMMGGALAIIILALFLRSVKPTLIIALSIPVSLLFAVAMMYFSGVTVNVISLAGLAMGVGMLVDNSIVVIENIYRLRAQGKSAAAAAVAGASQVAGAILSSTLTTVCVFLPIVFTQGLTRQLFTDMGLTIAYALMASLIIALTLVPTCASRAFINMKTKPQKRFEGFLEGYGKCLAFVLRHKAVVLTLVVLLLAASALCAFTMGTAFMPEMDSSQLMATMTMPEGSTTEQTRQTSDAVMEEIAALPGVSTVGAMEGTAASNEKTVSLYVLLSDERSVRSSEVADMLSGVAGKYGCELSVQSNTMDMSAMSGSGVEIVVSGRDMDVITKIAGDLAEMLRMVEGIKDINDGLEETTPETRVTVDKGKAMEYSLTVAQVYQQVAAVVQSQTDATTLSMQAGEYPVVVAGASANTLTRQTLGDIKIKGTKEGEEKEVALKDIAVITEERSPTVINREENERTVSVSAQIDSEHNIGLVGKVIEEKLAAYDVPEGYSARISGENEMINETLSDFMLMIIMSVALIYLIMVAQFQSFKSPFIVMFTIPLAFTGGLIALWITGFEISMISMLGFLVLSGIVVNNGIVFVDYVNRLRMGGVKKRAALIEAGKTRMRPIIMTAITTILGLSTLAAGLGSGAEMLQPMAVVTIGGLTYATALTLFVVPAMYDIFNKKPMKMVALEDEKDGV